MAHFLFPASASADKAKRKDDYPTLIADIVRGATDSIDALILFRSLVTGHSNGPDTLGFMAFDAHVGETGCHLRAGMVNDLFTTYRCLFQSSSGAWQAVETWLDETIARLEAVITQSRAACVKLTKDKVKPSVLGFNQKQETPRKVLVQLGWSEPEQTFSFATKAETFEPLTSASSSTTLQIDNSTDQDRTGWKILNSVILSRFVVYAYILSKYKAFSFYNGSPNGSLQPQAADGFTRELMENSWDSGAASVKRSGMRRLENEFRDLQVWLSELSCAWLQSLAKRSDLGCDMSRLISSTTQKSKLGLTAAACFPGYLLQREFLLRQSTPIILVDKHFCTEGYHLNVFEATVAPTPKSRPSGFLGRVKSLFKCMLPSSRNSKKNTQPPAANSNSNNLVSPLGLALRWRIKQTSIDALMAEGNPTTPHMVVTGNSLRGPHQQYTDLVRASLTAEPGSRPANSFPHNNSNDSSSSSSSNNDEKPVAAPSSSWSSSSSSSSPSPSPSPCRCAENEAHVAEFLRADHDRIALSFFAVHCAYSFPLTGEEKDEVAFVDKAMDAWAEEKEQVRGGIASPAAMWKASRDEADILGTGTGSMHLFRWQHAFAESKGRLGWLLQKSLNAAELMPLKAVMPGEGGDS